MKLSIVIIALDEKDLIAESIKSASFADEILVVDTGSTDETPKIAKKLGARTKELKFTNFADVRNKAKDMITGDWIFYLDADESISLRLKELIKSNINNSQYSAFKVRRINYFLGKKWPPDEKIIRLFDKKKLKNWFGEVHESPEVEGDIGFLEGDLIHHTHRKLNTMVEKTNKWSEIESSLLYDSSHPRIKSWRLLKVMLFMFYRYYISEQGFKLGTTGLIESIYQSFSVFITYSKLWEKQQNKL